MIDYLRSFIDQISLEALKFNIIFWILLWLVFKVASFSQFKKKIKLLESKYLKDLYLIVLFIVSFFLIRYQIKIDFIDKFLNIGPN